MTRYALGITLALLLGYALMEARPLLVGPTLTLSEPVAWLTATGTVRVSGRAGRAVALTLDDFPVLQDEQGRFAVERTFPAGGSILTMTATDRFGRSVSKTRYVYVP